MRYYLTFLLLFFLFSCGEAPSGWDGALVSEDGTVSDAGGSGDGGEDENNEPEPLALGHFESNYTEIYNNIFSDYPIITDSYTMTVSDLDIEEISSCINSDRIFEAGSFSVSYQLNIFYDASLNMENPDPTVTNSETNYDEAIVDENNECILTLNNSFSTGGETLSSTSRIKIRFKTDFSGSESIYSEVDNEWVLLEENALELSNVGDCQ